MKKLLMVIPLVFLFCFAFSYQDKEAMAEVEAMKAQAEIEEQNEALYRGIIEELNKGNTEVLTEFYAPDYVNYSPSNSTKPISREERIESTEMWFRAFPDANWRIEELFAVGDRVIVRNIVTGTHEGEFGGVPATGNKIEFSSIIILHIKNGKIIEQRGEADGLGFAMQLGMELKPKEEK